MAITDKAKGIKGISAFIVERGFKGFSIGKNELKMGMHGCTTAPLAFTDCEVPAENLLGARGHGLRAGAEDAHHGARHDRGALLRHDGQADRALRRLHEDARAGRQEDRRAPGPAVDARRHGGGARRRRGCSRSARSRCILRGERGTLEASVAKLFATEALGKVVDCAVQIHGGMGYMREAGIETVLPRRAHHAHLRGHAPRFSATSSPRSC